MKKKTRNFEIFINENEKVTVTVVLDLRYNTVNITGITLTNDTMVSLSDLGDKTQSFIREKATNYLAKIRSEDVGNLKEYELIDSGAICTGCLTIISPTETIYPKSKNPTHMPKDGSPLGQPFICENCKKQ